MAPEKSRTIVVNATEHEWAEKEISYDEVVNLAYGSAGTGPGITYTVTYRRGMGNKPEGSLTAGKSAGVKESMIFDVSRTDKS